MDIRLLKIFSAVATHGSLPAAAREVHLTASALSHGLKALETELGVRLFDRIGRRLVLNQAGEQLLQDVQPPLAALDQAAAGIKQLGQWGQARLRVGAPPIICQYLLPKVIYELDRNSPTLRLRIEAGDCNSLLRLLRENKIDLAVTVQADKTPDLQTTTLFQDELIFAFSREHPWGHSRSVSSADILAQRLILFDRSTWTAPFDQETAGPLRSKAVSQMELGSLELIKELVKLGMAPALLPPWVIQNEIADGTIQWRRWSSKPLTRRWTVSQRANVRLSLAEEQFLKLLRNSATSLGEQKKPLAQPV